MLLPLLVQRWMNHRHRHPHHLMAWALMGHSLSLLETYASSFVKPFGVSMGSRRAAWGNASASTINRTRPRRSVSFRLLVRLEVARENDGCVGSDANAVGSS